ncbi:hypothetical protein, partial [Mesorhizobium sp.]
MAIAFSFRSAPWQALRDPDKRDVLPDLKMMEAIAVFRRFRQERSAAQAGRTAAPADRSHTIAPRERSNDSAGPFRPLPALG